MNTRCSRTGRSSRSQEDIANNTSLKSALRHLGRKNYIEPDDDNSSDCSSPMRLRHKSSDSNISDRKLSLRRKDGKPNSPPGSNGKEGRRRCTYTDRKLKHQTLNDSVCCGNDDVTDARTRRSQSRRLITNGVDESLQNNRESSSRTKSEFVKPKVIDHFSQSDEINIESSQSVPKKSSTEHRKSHSSRASGAPKRKTLTQTYTENIVHKANGHLPHFVHHSNKAAAPVTTARLCRRKTKKTTIYHDGNDWTQSRGYWSTSCDFWQLNDFDDTGDKTAAIKRQQEIEVPSFREKKYAPLYKIE
ncbi:Hypothetical predicted protein, partial [Olea europaea subsp. europaea]